MSEIPLGDIHTKPRKKVSHNSYFVQREPAGLPSLPEPRLQKDKDLLGNSGAALQPDERVNTRSRSSSVLA